MPRLELELLRQQKQFGGGGEDQRKHCESSIFSGERTEEQRRSRSDVWEEPQKRFYGYAQDDSSDQLLASNVQFPNEVKFTPVKKPNAVKLADSGAKEMANVVSDSHRDDAAD
jgi:hypothetical protein